MVIKYLTGCTELLSPQSAGLCFGTYYPTTQYPTPAKPLIITTLYSKDFLNFIWSRKFAICLYVSWLFFLMYCFPVSPVHFAAHVRLHSFLIYFLIIESERERERSFLNLMVHFQTPTTATDQPGWNQDPWTQSGTPREWTRTRFFSHHTLLLRVHISRNLETVKAELKPRSLETPCRNTKSCLNGCTKCVWETKVWIYHIFFTHSIVDEHLHWIYSMGLNSAAVNTWLQVSLSYAELIYLDIYAQKWDKWFIW